MILRKWLTEQKMTQAQFADLIKSDQGHVSDLCTGKVRPKAASMDVIYKATNGAVAHGDWSLVQRPVRMKRLLKAVKASRKAER